MKHFKALGLCLLLSACNEPVVLRVVDGDTLEVGRDRIRIAGIDAPELEQRCINEYGFPYYCGWEAKKALSNVIAGRKVECFTLSRDYYGRRIATCNVAGLDLGEYMVRSGHAVAYTRYTTRYISHELDAKTARRGIWRGKFTDPELFRRSGDAFDANGVRVRLR